MNIIFENIREKDKNKIKKYLKKKDIIWIVEPFHAFHHQKNILFFPPSLPKFVNKLISQGIIHKISSQSINSRDIYRLSSEKGVANVEKVYVEYKQRNKKLIQFIIDTVGVKEAEFVFKKQLCMRIAIFFSINILIHRLSHIVKEQFFFFPDTNIEEYNNTKEMLLNCNIPFYQHTNVLFEKKMIFLSKMERYKNFILLLTQLFAQSFLSFFLSNRDSIIFPYREKKYLYGISIHGSGREFNGDQKGADFLVDGQLINKKDVIYFPLTKLTKKQTNQLKGFKSSFLYPPGVGHFFSNSREWLKLLNLVLINNFAEDNNLTKEACGVFLNYFRWRAILKKIKIKHFITHCDFSTNHIGRNIALKQKNIKTWYFTDSMNSSCNFIDETKNNYARHPFWTYLYYDYFVTWTRLLGEYYQSHPETFSNVKIVGCLWSQNIHNDDLNQFLEKYIPERFMNLTVISVFDTTYTNNGNTSYIEGIEFANNILRIVDENQDIYVLLKEKKGRSFHKNLNIEESINLIKQYDIMESHPRISVLSEKCDVSELISIADLVISFPFTSTTFEAICAGKNAIWHDPLGFYRKTPFALIKNTVTHSYKDLDNYLKVVKANKHKIMEKKRLNYHCFDPFYDDNAIGRFRNALKEHDK